MGWTEQDEYEKGLEDKGRIDGLKEAVEIIRANPWLTAGTYLPTIEARIAELESTRPTQDDKDR